MCAIQMTHYEKNLTAMDETLAIVVQHWQSRSRSIYATINHHPFGIDKVVCEVVFRIDEGDC